MYGLISDNELYHHGILGMKWGVRRFQNEDGTLTAAGKKRYSSMSEKKLYKTLKKSFRDKRAKNNGPSNRWLYSIEVGENGKKLRDEFNKNNKAYCDSKEVKDWMRGYDKLDKKLTRQFESGKISIKDYDEAMSAYYKTKPKKNFDDLAPAKTREIGGKWKYADDFVNKAGKKLSVARLKDLGYSEDVAKEFVERLAKKGYTLGDI